MRLAVRNAVLDAHTFRCVDSGTYIEIFSKLTLGRFVGTVCRNADGRVVTCSHAPMYWVFPLVRASTDMLMIYRKQRMRCGEDET